MDESFFVGFTRSQMMGKNLEGYKGINIGVQAFVDDAYATTTEVLEDLVVRNRLTNERGHDNSSMTRTTEKALITKGRRLARLLEEVLQKR